MIRTVGALSSPDAFLHGRGLQLHSDYLLQAEVIFLRVFAGDPHRSAIGLTQAFHNFDRRGFAGAIGPQKAKNLSRIDLEGDFIDRLKGIIAFFEIDDLYEFTQRMTS
jgi:hypothetical protein